MKKVLGLIMLVCSVNTQAAIVTWNITGTMGAAGYPAGNENTLSGVLDYGTAYTASLTFNDAILQNAHGHDDTIYTQYIDSLIEFNVAFENGIYANMQGGGIQMIGYYGHDQSIEGRFTASEIFHSVGTEPVMETNLFDYSLNRMGFYMFADTGLLYGDDAPIFNTLNLLDPYSAPYPDIRRLISLDFNDADGQYVASADLSIDSINVSAVPIPGAIWLFGTGLMALISISRTKKH